MGAHLSDSSLVPNKIKTFYQIQTLQAMQIGGKFLKDIKITK